MSETAVTAVVERLRELLDGPGREAEATMLRDGWRAALPQLHELRKEVRRIGAWAPHLPVAD
ncbi:MAG: hypothetical protein LH467_02610, partial [Gemmatimonadaceae bacterium]|nr:hypothetical protein [Gemmatimonadaceae bacterium]